MRALTPAVLVCKRGPAGAVVFPGPVDSLDGGVAGPGFAVEVFNVLGAGDGFMAGLLKGWLGGEGWARALEYANACGAFAVSRHGCAPSYPTLAELDVFLGRGPVRPDLRHDAELEHVHRATTRGGDWPVLRAFAFDHRAQFEAMAGATPQAIGRFKALCLEAALRVAGGRPGYGVLCDGRLGRGRCTGRRGRGCGWRGRRNGRGRGPWRSSPSWARIAAGWRTGRAGRW